MLDFYAMRALDYFKKEKNKRYKTNLKSYALNNEGIKYEEKEKVLVIEDGLRFDERVSIRRQLMKDLRQYVPKYKMKISEMDLDYYDKCLVKFLENMHRRRMALEDTCWYKYAQTNKCVDLLDSDETFEHRRSIFLSKAKELDKNHFTEDELFAEDGFLYFRNANKDLDDFRKSSDKLLELYDSISRKWKHHLAECPPIIIGRSDKTGKYHMIAGRHRIACLQYLQSRGALGRGFTIRCHLVRYPYDKIVYTRPYFDTCKKCRWSEEAGSEPETQQGFSISKGFVNILRKKSNDKWRLIRPIFGELVGKRSVLDIGAQRGLYCFKALENGAKTATALEISKEYADSIRSMATHIAEENQFTLNGDFYDEETFAMLVDRKYDVIFLFGIIHHLLRQGIQRNLLTTFEELFAKISSISQVGIIVEFAEPTEASLNLPEVSPFREEFKIDKFLKALKRHYSQVNLLGKCKYRPNRLMYDALR